MAQLLRDAVRRGDLVRAKELLDNDGTKRAINVLDNGSSCLHLAIGTKQISMCLLLLSSGADPNQEDACGYAPIHLAVLVAEQVTANEDYSCLCCVCMHGAVCQHLFTYSNVWTTGGATAPASEADAPGAGAASAEPHAIRQGGGCSRQRGEQQLRGG
jgi:hypothetical protein